MARSKHKRVISLQASRRLAPPSTGPTLGDSELGRALAGVIVVQQLRGDVLSMLDGVAVQVAASAALAVVIGGGLDDNTRQQLCNLMADTRPPGVDGAHWQAHQPPAAVEVFEVLRREGYL